MLSSPLSAEPFLPTLFHVPTRHASLTDIALPFPEFGSRVLHMATRTIGEGDISSIPHAPVSRGSSGIDVSRVLHAIDAAATDYSSLGRFKHS